jgi:ABC-type sugar transport system ATPase subunit
MASISLEGVTKVYPNGLQAIDGLDLHIDDGEFMVVVGPSGCGKTTVLRMVAKLGGIRFRHDQRLSKKSQIFTIPR